MTPEVQSSISTESSPEQSKNNSHVIANPRGPNWSLNEIHTLCAYVREHHVKILGAQQDGPGKNAKKQRLWQKVTELINEESHQNRTLKQVRKKWVDLTYLAKSYARTSKNQDLTMDSRGDDKLTPIIKEVLAALAPSRLLQSVSSTNNDSELETSDVSFESRERQTDDSSSTSKSSQSLSYSAGSESCDEDVFERSLPEQHSDNTSVSSSPSGRLSRSAASNARQFTSIQGLSNVRNETRRPIGRHNVNEIAKEQAVGHTERKRYRGAHRRFSPYFENTDRMETRKQASRNISRTCFTEKWSDEKENIERLELEKEKVRLKRAKLSLLKESLDDQKEQLVVKKEMLFCLQGIAKSLKNLNQEQVMNFGRNFSSRNKNLSQYMMDRYYGD